MSDDRLWHAVTKLPTLKDFDKERDHWLEFLKDYKRKTADLSSEVKVGLKLLERYDEVLCLKA